MSLDDAAFYAAVIMGAMFLVLIIACIIVDFFER